MQSVDNSQSSGEYCYRLYWVHALIRHYSRPGFKYLEAPIIRIAYASDYVIEKLHHCPIY